MVGIQQSRDRIVGQVESNIKPNAEMLRQINFEASAHHSYDGMFVGWRESHTHVIRFKSIRPSI